MANPNPIVGIGNILLRNATELLLGGIRVRNCSSTQGITGWFANLTGICSDLGGAGLGIKQLTFGAGLFGNESPLFTNGTIFLENASAGEIGGVLASNCSTIGSFSGITGGGAFSCADAGAGRGIRQITIFAPLTGNESPNILTNATLMVDNATTASQGVVLVSNCTTGSFIQGWTAGNTPVCGIPSSGNMNISTQLLYSNHTEFNLTASGDCYRYTLPANQFDQVYVTGYADMHGTAGSPVSWNATINFSNTESKNMQARSGSILTSYGIVPVSLSYNQTQSASVDITMRGVEIEDGGSFICEGMSVWGVNNASFVSRDHGNPYCNPLVGESCLFYNFKSDMSKEVNPTQLFSVASYASCTLDAYGRKFQGFGIGRCPDGFMGLGLPVAASGVAGLTFYSPTNNFTTSYCGSAGTMYNCTIGLNTSELFEVSTRFANDNFSAGDGMNTGGGNNVTMLFGYFQRNDTAATTQSNWTPNGLQNLIAFYHYRNETNWSAITMNGGNASNQTTVLPLDFNSTATFINFNTFRIIRENSTGNMLFYINTSLVANHSSFVPTGAAFVGWGLIRHNATVASDVRFLTLDWVKYYSNNRRGAFMESYP